MNIKSYLFRSMIAGIAFLLGISAQRNLWELDRSCRQWLNTAAAVLPFQSAYENLFGAKASAASGDLTGEYYLSEEVVPGGFTDFARIEFTTHNYAHGAPILPTGAICADRVYKFISVAISRELLTFETEEKGGIRYRFKGKVLQGDMKEEESPELGGDIVGKLEKFKNGSVIAAIDTTFFLFGS